MLVIGIVTCYLENGNKISPYLMPTFVLIYLQVRTWHLEMLMSSSSSSSSSAFPVPNLPHLPNQPIDYNFPRRQFGKSKVTYRSFQRQWFKQWKWLHYDTAKDLAYCHHCVSARNFGKMQLKGNALQLFFLTSLTGRMLLDVFTSMN